MPGTVLQGCKFRSQEALGLSMRPILSCGIGLYDLPFSVGLLDFQTVCLRTLRAHPETPAEASLGYLQRRGERGSGPLPWLAGSGRRRRAQIPKYRACTSKLLPRFLVLEPLSTNVVFTCMYMRTHMQKELHKDVTCVHTYANVCVCIYIYIHIM